MSIFDKLNVIADNVALVYLAGYNLGKEDGIIEGKRAAYAELNAVSANNASSDHDENIDG